MPFIESNVDIRSTVRLMDQPAPAPGDEIRASLNVVTPGYFSRDGRPLVKGRLIEDRDGADAPRVVVVSEAFADRYLHGIDPIGQRVEFRVSGKPSQAQIVGVIGGAASRKARRGAAGRDHGAVRTDRRRAR